ncbi:MAG: hypothetical protein QXX91_02225, partial [Thermoplasmata archaeon]
MTINGKWEWKKFLGKYYLKYEGRVFSIINTKKIYTNSYWDLFLPFIEMFNEPRVIMIGLGGGTTLYQVRKFFKNVHFETVEISMKSFEMASKFIDMKNEIVHICDGYDFVLSCSKTFDIIILDAYDSSGIPIKFLDKEFIDNIARILNNGGFFLINYALTIQARVRLKNFLNLLRTYFNVYLIGPTLIENNIVIVASKYEKNEIFEKLNKSKLRK